MEIGTNRRLNFLDTVIIDENKIIFDKYKLILKTRKDLEEPLEEKEETSQEDSKELENKDIETHELKIGDNLKENLGMLKANQSLIARKQNELTDTDQSEEEERKEFVDDVPQSYKRIEERDDKEVWKQAIRGLAIK
ncbi:hypothetical protein ALC56_06400 [Trachymyrmex septentrionalis]|uniref:Uncharacterized protein n=1 Tax=Trachymyrmex septentrionalis TaxID=34720 RepID=A0A151JWZ3_9HYME|nr:hypothetical protein ALC56_06400 [Trachymyrmex septentrionalis]